MSRLSRRAVISTRILAAVTVGALALTACTNSSSTAASSTSTAAASAADTAAAGSGSAAAPSGEKIKIGFSAPAADHGWMGSITKSAVAEAEALGDVDLIVASGTNDVNQQISQVETFINDKVDAIVLLPFDGAQMTDTAQKASDAGIVVVNVDRIFSSPLAYRTYIGGDNYGMGVSAGRYIGQTLKDKGVASPKIAEIQGIASLPLTVDRSKGFSDALATYGFKVSNQVSAEFTADSGEEVTSNLLQAAPQLDAIWNHDDDQGVGVLAAIQNAGRNEFFMVGGAGSANVMRDIKADNTVLKATVIYPPTQAASGILLGRLLVLNKGMADLEEQEVPKSITLYSAVVTKENVDTYLPSAFES